MAIYYGRKMVLGVPKELKPLIGAPEGRKRFRFRNDSLGMVRIRTVDGIREFFLEDLGDTWGIISERGRNYRTTK